MYQFFYLKGMLKFKNNLSPLYLLSICILYVCCLLLCTEYLFDCSILAYKTVYVSFVGFSISIPVIYILIGKEGLSSALSICTYLIFISSMLQTLFKTTYGIYYVEDTTAVALIKLIKQSNTKNINTIGNLLTSNFHVNLLLYGEKDIYYDRCLLPLLTKEDVDSRKKDLIDTIFLEGKKRQSTEDIIFIERDLNDLDIRNMGDFSLLAHMLHSIYYSKFNKNTVILLKINNYDELVNCGFNRKIENKDEFVKNEKKKNKIIKENNLKKLQELKKSVNILEQDVDKAEEEIIKFNSKLLTNENMTEVQERVYNYLRYLSENT